MTHHPNQVDSTQRDRDSSTESTERNDLAPQSDVDESSRGEVANPYQPTRARTGPSPSSEPSSWWWTALAGAIWSLASAFPIAALMALVFRFPVPFVGIDSGVDHVIPTMIGLWLYGIIGGFPLLAAAGAGAGLLACTWTNDPASRKRLQRILSVGVTAVLLFVLATLDWYIGPW